MTMFLKLGEMVNHQNANQYTFRSFYVLVDFDDFMYK